MLQHSYLEGHIIITKEDNTVLPNLLIHFFLFIPSIENGWGRDKLFFIKTKKWPTSRSINGFLIDFFFHYCLLLVVLHKIVTSMDVLLFKLIHGLILWSPGQRSVVFWGVSVDFSGLYWNIYGLKTSFSFLSIIPKGTQMHTLYITYINVSFYITFIRFHYIGQE